MVAYLRQQVTILHQNTSEPVKPIITPTTRSLHGGNSDDALGFIDASSIGQWNAVSANDSLLYRVHRHPQQFDFSILLLTGIATLCSIIGTEWHRRVFVKKLSDHYRRHASVVPAATLAHRSKAGCMTGLVLFIALLVLVLLDRYYTTLVQKLYTATFLPAYPFAVYLCLEHLCDMTLGRFTRGNGKDQSVGYQWLRVGLLLASLTIFFLWFVNRSTDMGYLMGNGLVFALTVVIIVQMRLANLLDCIIILGWIVFFEALLWILDSRFLVFRTTFDDAATQKMLAVRRALPTGTWRSNGIRHEHGISDREEFIQQLYLDLVSESLRWKSIRTVV